MSEEQANRETGNAWKSAYTLIKDLIFSMEFRPGDIVSENRMAQRLGISRTPVREALKKLEQEGLIIASNRRKRVYVLTVKEIQEIFDLKKVVEGSIARWAAERGSEEDVGKLQAIIEEMGEIAAGKPEGTMEQEEWKHAWLEADKRYHEQLFAMAGNQRAAQLIRSLNTYWHRLRLGIVAIEGRIEISQAEHRKITEAITGRDPEGAQKAAVSHLENLKNMLVNIMKVFHYPE
jgi:DNA-binding GntR family transcriptional regulator